MKNLFVLLALILLGAGSTMAATHEVVGPIRLTSVQAERIAQPISTIDADYCCMSATASGCCGDSEISVTATSCSFGGCAVAYILASNTANRGLNTIQEDCAAN